MRPTSLWLLLVLAPWPCRSQTPGPRPDSTYLVPSNQLISPAGTQIYLPGGRPVGLVTLDNGYLLIKDIRSLDIVSLNDRKVQTLPYPQGGASFNGLCLSPD